MEKGPQMAGRHSWAKMSPEAQARADRKTRALQQLIEEGRASGEPVEGEATLRRPRDRYAAMAAPKAGRTEDDGS
jgi:hypothetical protein